MVPSVVCVLKGLTEKGIKSIAYNRETWWWFCNGMGCDISRMVWPLQSCYLNVIEQIWDHFDTKLRKMCNTSTITLWLNLQSVWANISNETFSKYILTMKSRCEAVIEAKWSNQVLKQCFVRISSFNFASNLTLSPVMCTSYSDLFENLTSYF